MKHVSIEIIRGQIYEAKFRIHSESGVGYDNLDTYSSSQLVLKDILTKDTFKTYNCSKDTTTINDNEYNVVRVLISAAYTSHLKTRIDAVDMEFQPRAKYFGILTVNFTDKSPINVVIDRIVVI